MAKQALNIGFFSCMYSQINGTAHAVRFLSEAIAKTGHNVHVFAPRIENGYKKPKNLYYHDLGGARISKDTGFVLSVPIHKIFFCKEDYLDIAHIHTHATIGSMAINWAKYLGIPMIGTHNSPMTFYTAQYVPFLGSLLANSDIIWRYERHVVDKYDLVHVATKSKKKLLREKKFKEPIICLTNGIHDYYFQNVKENGIREKYNLQDKKILLSAARLSPEKHPISLIKTFKNIHKKDPDSHFVIVGNSGPSTGLVKRFIRKWRLENCVSYLGMVPFEDLLKLYNAADLTCLWSWVEAEGLVLIEAMAQGTPNVGANGYGIRDVIRHGETGFLANNLHEFEEYVLKLLKDESLREEFGKKAKKIASRYKISEVAKTWIKIYKFVINELYPLRYYRKERKERVELVKEFIHHLPNVSF
ncbi:MAG: glycosyltransferase [Promethearchaeota archaeon]